MHGPTHIKFTNWTPEVGSNSDGRCLADQIRLVAIKVANWEPNWPPTPDRTPAADTV